MTELRTIYLSAGNDVAGYLWLHGYDREKNDLSIATVAFGLQPITVSADIPPATWIAYNGAFDSRDLTVPVGEIRVGILVGSGGHGSGDGFVTGEYWTWLKPTDHPEVEPFNCGKVRIA